MMILLKCLVLSPVDEVCVLGRGRDVSGESEMWQKKKRKERKKEQALRPIHKVVYLVASLSLKALHCTPFSGYPSTGVPKHVDPQKNT